MAKKKRKFGEQLTSEISAEIQQQNANEAAKAEFEALRNHPAWMRILSILDPKIVDLAEEILDTDTQGEDLNRLRDRRDLCLWFRNLPEIMIKAIDEPVQPELQDFDPYDRAEVDKIEKAT